MSEVPIKMLFERYLRVSIIVEKLILIQNSSFCENYTLRRASNI